MFFIHLAFPSLFSPKVSTWRNMKNTSHQPVSPIVSIKVFFSSTRNLVLLDLYILVILSSNELYHDSWLKSILRIYLIWSNGLMVNSRYEARVTRDILLCCSTRLIQLTTFPFSQRKQVHDSTEEAAYCVYPGRWEWAKKEREPSSQTVLYICQRMMGGAWLGEGDP